MSEHRRKPPEPQGGGRAAARRAAQQSSGRRAAPSRGSAADPAPNSEPDGQERPSGGRAEAPVPAISASTFVNAAAGTTS
ncbi:hypothetical protein ACWHIR_30495, partial [Streptomyces celluloflavus]